MGATTRARRAFTVAINPEYCKGCGICVEVCPTDVLILNDRLKAEAANIAACTGCLNCEIYCPDFAVDVQEVEAR